MRRIDRAGGGATLRAAWRALACLAPLMLAVAPPSARAEDEYEERPQPRIPTTWHATAYVRGRMGMRVIDYWSRGNDMRARTLISGHPVTTIVRGDRYVVLDELTGRGVEIRRSKAARELDKRRARPFAFELAELIEQGGEKVEDVKLGSMAGEIWRITDGNGRRKVWVTRDPPRIPLRVETFSRASSDTIELDYSNWVFDLELPDSFFVTPAGYDIERYEYDDYVQKSGAGTARRIPILYPDLLHGNPAR